MMSRSGMTFLLVMRVFAGCIQMECFAAPQPQQPAPKVKAGVAKPTADETALEWFRKGEELIATPQENSDEQLQFFRKAAELKSDFWEARFNVGLILANQKKGDQALEEFNALLAMNPRHGRALFMAGMLNQEHGRWAEAESFYRQALALNDKDNSARKGLAMALIRQNKQDETLAVLKGGRRFQISKLKGEAPAFG